MAKKTAKQEMFENQYFNDIKEALEKSPGNMEYSGEFGDKITVYTMQNSEKIDRLQYPYYEVGLNSLKLNGRDVENITHISQEFIDGLYYQLTYFHRYKKFPEKGNRLPEEYHEQLRKKAKAVALELGHSGK